MTGRPPVVAEEKLIHGTCVDVGGAGFLLLGPPGSGKSDLALRLIDQVGSGTDGIAKPAQLVADDQVVVRRDGARLFARPPVALAGLLEVRGLGPVRVSFLAETRLAAVVVLKGHGGIERLPDPGVSRYDILGLLLPLFEIDPAAASASARVRAAADWLRSS